MVELISVHKTLSARPILKGLNLKVEDGETLVIIGRSGIGKSVTLRHIVGLMKPDSGTVKVFGRDLSTLSPRELRRHRLQVGYLFQDGALLAWLTVGENVALPLREHSRSRPREVRTKVLDTLELVELREHADKRPSEISGGMRKRAGLARALVLAPRIVLYDEPTSGLDPISSSLINKLIRDLQRRLGITQIVVTHDMDSAYEIGDRIALLHDGRIQSVGSPEEIRSSDDPSVDQFIHGLISGPLSRNREDSHPEPQTQES